MNTNINESDILRMKKSVLAEKIRKNIEFIKNRIEIQSKKGYTNSKIGYNQAGWHFQYFEIMYTNVDIENQQRVLRILTQ